MEIFKVKMTGNLICRLLISSTLLLATAVRVVFGGWEFDVLVRYFLVGIIFIYLLSKVVVVPYVELAVSGFVFFTYMVFNTSMPLLQAPLYQFLLTSHLMGTLIPYAIMFIYMSRTKGVSVPNGLVILFFSVASYECFSIFVQTMMFGVENLAQVSFYVLVGFIPMLYPLVRRRVSFSRKIVITLSIVFLIELLRIRFDLFSISRYDPSVGYWVLSFEGSPVGVLSLYLTKWIHVFGVGSYAEIQGIPEIQETS